MSPDEDGNWNWSFTNLPKYKEGAVGKEIIYTISEDAVENYTTEIDGYNATNTYQPGKTSVSVVKSWNDSDNRGGKRPDSVQVQLYADGKAMGDPIELNNSGNWRYTWSDLDVKVDGNKVEYTVKEVGESKGSVDFNGTGYNVTYTGDASKGYVITNSYNATSTGVQTEDNTSATPRLAMMIAAMAVAGMTVMYRRRRRDEI